MKTVELFREYRYTPATDRRVTIRFEGGMIYRRVLETAAREIERKGAGRIISAPQAGATGIPVADAGHAFRRRR